ncbi:unnamed protein product [Mucor hiemalis]
MTFEETLTEAGSVEPVLFRRALGNKLRSQTNGFEEFNLNLQWYTEAPEVFRKLLLPSAIADHVPKTTRTSSTESLFKTLLAIDFIQPDLINYLLERLPEFYDELENDNSSSCTARLILHQLRWLDYIAEPEVLTGKLIEIISITPAVIQHELITSLPDIINDSEHKPIVVYLKELMNENPELTVPILDSLSNLTLHSESLEDVRETVLERLESAELDDLAVIVKFLLQTASPIAIDSIVYGIRQNLDFRALGKVQQQQQQQQSSQLQRRYAKQPPEALILESIKLGLQFHKFVCDVWLKAIVALESQREHKVIDMLVLIILYSMTSMKKKVETIFKKKIIRGSITANLIQETITYHADGLLSYWGTLLSLSESTLRACQQNNIISPCASTLYVSSFKSSDAYYRQEIVGALVTHIGSGVEAEMNIALNVLLSLVKFDVNSVAVYSVFVKGILDYLDNLNLYQIRTLFDIFSLLALTTGSSADGSANLWSEIQIVIRKQLSNPREKYKNIGIIASLSAVKVLGSRRLCHDSNAAGGSSTSSVVRSSQASNVLRHPLLRQATSLLDLAIRFSKDYPSCVALMYDELAYMLSEEDIDDRLQMWIKDSMTSDFTDFYVITASEAENYIREAQSSHFVKLEPEIKMNLDAEDCEIAIKIFESVYSPDVRSKKITLVPMCSVFNLMQSCEKKINNGNLQDIDALFGCGITLFKSKDMEEITLEESTYACDMLFYTINWFKAVLNAFIFSKEENYRTRLIARLRNILELENILSNMLVQTPKYVPLEFHATAASTDRNRLSSQLFNSPSPNISQEIAINENVGQKVPKKDHKSTTMAFASVSELRPYMRAFNINILEILKYNEELEKNEEKISYEELNYLLKDLDQKLDVKIIPAPATLFGKKKAVAEVPACNATLLARMDSHQVMKKVIVYLPHLLQTLENLNTTLQTMNIEAGRIEDESEEIVGSVSLIFSIIHKLLLWPDIQNSDNSSILHDIVHALAERISAAKSKSASSLEADFNQACQYLAQYGETIPQANTAVLLFNILQRIAFFSESPAVLKSTSLLVVSQIIRVDWFDWRDIKKQIPYLVEQWIELSEDPLDVLHNLVNNVLPRFEEEGKLEEHPLLKVDTVIQYYQAIINQTIKAFDLMQNTDREAEVVLVENARIVRIFERITFYVKSKEQRILLGVLLKTSRLFIEAFRKHSIPYFTRVFKNHKEDVVAIFKDFQGTTRMLQIICSHVKVLKEVTLSAYVPPLKRALEMVIYEVKMLLTENGMPANAFFMGALKHRDIRGAEISSQIPRQEEEDEEDDEMDEATSGHNESDEDQDNSPVSKQSRKPIVADAERQCRSASIVPSSSEDDNDNNGDDESGEDLPDTSTSRIGKKRFIEQSSEENEEEVGKEIEIPEQEEEEEVMEINFGSSENEEDSDNDKENEEGNDDDDELPPVSSSPPEQRRDDNKKRKILRVGIGRPKYSSQGKLFDLTSRPGPKKR